MDIFSELLLIILVGLAIGYPLFLKKQRVIKEDNTLDLNGLPHLLVQKEVAYATLKDLDFDFKTGKLSEEDYQELKSRYEEEALSILEKIDKFSKKQSNPAKKTRKKQRAKKSRS